jgi:hypothetical protein
MTHAINEGENLGFVKTTDALDPLWREKGDPSLNLPLFGLLYDRKEAE